MNADYEKGSIEKKTFVNSFDEVTSVEDTSGAVSDSKLGFFGKIASKLNAETKGIELVTDEEKVGDSLWDAASMWLSANFVIATFSLGALGVTVFGLSFWQCVLIIIFFNMLGVVSVAFFSLFGPRLGLRQLVVSKFLVGNIAMRIFAFINCVACVGWGAVNIMSSAQLLHIVNNQACPPWAACLILVICTILVSFFGYRAIHMYERWAWVPNFVCFMAIIARMAKSGNFTFGEMKGGVTTAGSCLSFGGTIYGFATGWTCYASDYTVYQRRDINAYKVFFSVFFGLCTPLVFTMILGAACGTGILTDPEWAEMYNEHSIGGLVYSILVTNSLHGFGQFLCVLLALSTVANNVPNMYSVAMSAQAFWSPLQKIPRIAWTLAGNFVTLAICIPGYYHFESVFDNFMNLIGYYLAIYQAIAYSEHFIYQKGDFSRYDYENHASRESHPLGLAGTFAFCCGVAGAVLGMCQTWYTGPIGGLIGEFGGEVGFELAFGFTFIAYNITRPFERKYIGR